MHTSSVISHPLHLTTTTSLPEHLSKYGSKFVRQISKINQNFISRQTSPLASTWIDLKNVFQSRKNGRGVQPPTPPIAWLVVVVERRRRWKITGSGGSGGAISLQGAQVGQHGGGREAATATTPATLPL